MATKIFFADWQAGFPGIAGCAGIDFICENDPMANDHLSMPTEVSERRAFLKV